MFFPQPVQVLDKRQLGSGMQLSKVYLIHERANQEDAPAQRAADFPAPKGREAYPGPTVACRQW